MTCLKFSVSSDICLNLREFNDLVNILVKKTPRSTLMKIYSTCDKGTVLQGYYIGK